MKHRFTFLCFVASAGMVLSQDGAPPPPAPGAPPDAPPPAEVPVEAPVATPPPTNSSEAPAPAANENKAIPQAYSEEHYAATWARNPFLIKTVVEGPKVGPGFAEDWELRGLTKVKGEPEALLGNKKTQEFKWIRGTEDKDGFKLLEAKFDRDIHKASVEVSKTGEPSKATFTFPEVAAAPTGGPGGARTGIPGAMVPGGMNKPMPPGGNPNMPRPGQPAMPAPQAGQPSNNNNRFPVPNNGARPNVPIPAQPTTTNRRRVLIPPQPAPPGS